MPALLGLARMAHMSVYDYVHRHSLLPFTCFASRKCNGPTQYNPFDRLVARTRWITPRKLAYYCPECARQDRRERGFGYWRRAHQLPARFYCPTHHEQLLAAVKHDVAYSRTTCYWLDEGAASRYEEISLPRPDSTVERFHAITRAMLESPIGRNIEDVSTILTRRASAGGLTIANTPKFVQDLGLAKKRLSHLVRDTVQAEVVAELFPKLVGCDPGHACISVDQAVSLRRNGSPLSTATAMAMTILFPSVEDAMAALATDESEFIRRPGVVVGEGEAVVENAGRDAEVLKRPRLKPISPTLLGAVVAC